MAKNRKKKKAPDALSSASTPITLKKTSIGGGNDLLSAQKTFLKSIPQKVKNNFFDPSVVSPEVRGEIWGRQASLGESLVNQYSWATPDERALRILKHFAPIVEIGCGANAYWMRTAMDNGVDVVGFDTSLKDGGKIKSNASHDNSSDNKTKKRKHDDIMLTKQLPLHHGGPEVLSSEKWENVLKDRTLFLCYCDEEIKIDINDSNGDDSNPPSSMGSQCLAHFRGDTIIHVGELFGDNLSLDQAPWGRSSSPDFQEQLAAQFHCILKAQLTNWLHVRDTISVWRRTQTSTIVFQGETEEDSDEEDEMKHIPIDEIFPKDLAAPCVKHLL